MKCNYDINDAFDYLDGQSDTEFAQQLEQCEACANHVAECQMARSVWSSVETPELTDDQWATLDRKIRQQIIDEESANKPYWMPSFGRQLAWSGALAALAIAAYVSVVSSGNPTDKTAPATPKTTIASLTAGDEVKTTTEPKRVTVAQARIDIAQQSSVKVESLTDENTVIKLESGAVTLDVSPRPTGVTFQVTANDVLVTVVGTRFTVAINDDDSVLVSVEHGRVSVNQEGTEPTLLTDGGSIRKPAMKWVAEQGATAKLPSEQTPDASEQMEKRKRNNQTTAPSPDTTNETAKSASKVSRQKSKRAKRSSPKKKRQQKPGSNSTIGTAPKTIEKTTSKVPSTAARAVVENKLQVTEASQKTSAQTETEIDEQSPEAGTRIEALKTTDVGRSKLRQIVKRIGQISYSECVAQLQSWMANHRRHRKWNDAYYALGYCEFHRGNKKRANKIFTSKRLSKHRMLRKAGDYFNPRRPR